MTAAEAAPSTSKVAKLKIAVDNAKPEEEDNREVVPPCGAPLAVIRHVLKDHTDEQGHLRLRKWNGDFYGYVGPHYVISHPESLRKWLYERLENTVYLKEGKEGEEPERVPWCPSKGKIDQLIDALAAPTLIPIEVNPPSWLSTGESAEGFVPCQNGLVEIKTKKRYASTPNYFGTVCIPFDYKEDAEPPVAWIQFLRTLWKPVPVTGCAGHLMGDKVLACPGVHEAEEIKTLQQWFGLILSGRLSLQKMLLLVGPPRSGKGTIARILRDLIGAVNCSAPTLSGIAQNFGLETSIGKTLMIVGDARLSQQGQETVVERLLSISGQDTITLDRKNKTAWTGTMQTRIMILSNELPRFVDVSGAIASRFVILRLSTSFLGKEDTALEDRLRAEFPGILRWALDGLEDLDAAGRLFEPASHAAAMDELFDMVSPITAYLRDVCGSNGELNLQIAEPFATLYASYQEWCEENGRHAKNTSGFSSDLKTKLPAISTDYRPRDNSGRKLPRHVVGIQITKEWKERVKPERSRRNAWS